MSVPDHHHLVEQVYAAGGHTLITKAGAGLFVEAVARALHAADPEWGHLRKPEGRTHVVDGQGNRHAVDVVLYRRAGQIVDIIRDAGEPGAGLSWSPGPENEYKGESDWYAPVLGAGGTDPTPGPTPKPPIVPPVDDSVLAALRHLGEQYAALAGQMGDMGRDVANLLRQSSRGQKGTASGPITLPIVGTRTVTLAVELKPNEMP